MLPGEDHELYQRRRAALIERHQPQDEATRFEADWAARAAWRMERGEAVEQVIALKAIQDAEEGGDASQVEEADRHGAQLPVAPASSLRQLRMTPAGCLWCLAQYDILQTHLATHVGLLGTQRQLAFHLVGKRMTDVLTGDPLAIRWYSAVFGATFGNQGDTIDLVTKSLGSKPPAGMSTAEFPIRVKDLAAAIPGQAEGGIRLKAYVAEAIAEAPGAARVRGGDS